MCLYLSTCYFKCLWLGGTVTQHRDLYLRLVWSLQSVYGLLIGHLLAYERFTVNPYYLVAGYKTYLLCRTALYHILHMYGILSDDKLYAYAVERTLQVIGGIACFLGRDIHRVGVKL